MRHLVAVAVLALFVVPTYARKALLPDLSGHWLLETQPPPIAGRLPVCASECTLAQSEGVLTVAEGMHGRTYKLDGVPAVAIATTTDITAKITTTATWDGATLVISELIESAQLNGGKAFTTTARFSLDGDRLTMEGVRSTNDGAIENYRVVYRRART